MAEISKAYDPSSVESKWYETWERTGAFKGKRDDSREPFAIMIPPPNVTGMLHMGHILNNTLQDMLIRRARLEGKAALWQPGTDHAGIATQTKVEKEIRKAGLHRRDLGREKFVDKVWEWKETHGSIILNQLRKLGASCDWDRTAFTLDEGYQRAVLTAFVKLYQRGYIYRGLRMSNWCPVSLTALSNEEVIMKPQKSKLWKMRYELVNPSTKADGSPLTHLEISTTRPETIMGDTAVAVNPEDERYQHLIGTFVYRPFPKTPIPIVADAAVDKTFGTGCLKVTPAHDQVDFDIGKRHNLEVIDVLNPDATLNELAGEPFVGLDRFAARKLAVKMLDEQGLLVSEEEYDNNVGFSERADVPVEPRLTEQWWLRYPKVDEAKRVVESGIINFHPKRWENVYLHWLNHGQENNIDWCLSRQLWWGHRIPVWYKKGIDRSEVDLDNPDHIHVSVDGPSDPENWEQEEDVLDTWASSWLWPFATLGWPGDSEDTKKDLEFFYPTSVLATGFDIIFLWVARMIMAGLEFMGDEKKSLTEEELRARIPFKDVYITGLIRDEKGRKMSKSLGNSPDPLDLIAKYGADGVRFGIINIAPSGQDILFSEERIEIGRNFCNKLWNACRFRQMSGASFDNSSIEVILNRINGDLFDDYDHWILSRLLETNQKLADSYRLFECNQVTHILYEFFWSDFCDTYVEVSKSKLSQEDLKQNVLGIQDLIIRQLLLMLEPLTPFITEELWSQLGYAQNDKLLQENQIETSEELGKLFAAGALHLDKEAAGQVDKLEELISKTRALKAEFNLGNKRDVSLFYKSSETASALIERNKGSLLKQIGAESFEASSEDKDLPASVSELGTVYLDLTSSVDPEAEKERLQKEIQKIDKAIMAGESKLKNEKFMSNAPANIVEGARAQLAESVAKKEELTNLLVRLG
ncbi:MAG: valine--tRNA ligase [Verrucomicrobia bacterium]|nr:valine--tRNA ligase [Verrucomicrobiota bacterium]